MTDAFDNRWDTSTSAAGAESFSATERKFRGRTTLPQAEWRMMQRIHHTTTDLSLSTGLAFRRDSMASVLEPFRRKRPLFCDFNMIHAGFSGERLRQERRERAYCSQQEDEALPETFANRLGDKESAAEGNEKAGYIHLCRGTEIPERPKAPPQRHGRVILLNGASSAGKSTLARAMQLLMKEEAMMFSMDDYLAMSRGRHENALDAVRETGLPFIQSFHAAIAEAARKGALAIVDHVIGESRLWVEDLLNRLSGIPRALVRVECRQDILMERERRRTDRTPDLPHAERQHGSIHRHFPHDLSIDTSEATPQECATELINRLPLEFLMRQEQPKKESPGVRRDSIVEIG